MWDRDAILITQDKKFTINMFQHHMTLTFVSKRSASLVNMSSTDKSLLSQIPTFRDWDDVSDNHDFSSKN